MSRGSGSHIRHFDCPVCGKHVRLTNLHFRWVTARGEVVRSHVVRHTGTRFFARTNTHVLAHFRAGESALLNEWGKRPVFA